MEQSIDIKGVLSNDPNVFFFTLSLSLTQQGVVECTSESMARGSLLFQELFKLPWVEKAAAEGRALIVRKKSPSPSWDECAPQIAAIIRRLHESNQDFFSNEYLLDHKKKTIETEKKKTNYAIHKENVETPLGQAIEQVLNEKIAPGLASHGGYVTLVDLKEGEVYLYFGGGCQGCSQASNTVKLGIERILLADFPELHKVVDVTDHAQGKNPFFK